MKKILLAISIIFSVITYGKDFTVELISKSQVINMSNLKEEAKKYKTIYTSNLVSVNEKGREVMFYDYTGELSPLGKSKKYDKASLDILKENVYYTYGTKGNFGIIYINKNGIPRKRINFNNANKSNGMLNHFEVKEYVGKFTKTPFFKSEGKEFYCFAQRFFGQSEKDKNLYIEHRTYYKFRDSENGYLNEAIAEYDLETGELIYFDER